MYSEDEHGNVTLTMTREDFEGVLLALGIATSTAMNESTPSGIRAAKRLLVLLNRLNEGNPNYRAYSEPLI